MRKFLRTASRVAGKSNHSSFMHAAILVKGGSIISTAANKGHKHAEVLCISKCANLRGTTLISIRITKGGKLLAMAKPCPNCERFLKEKGIKTVFYSTSDRQIAKMSL
jgi:deoxycytidylate deaminase